MTREENIAKLSELRTKAEDLTASYNEAMQNGTFDETLKLNNEISETVNEYTSVVQGMCFEDCKDSGNPMLFAVEHLSFVTIGIKDEKKGDEKLPVRSVIEKDKQIDLLKLDKFCGGIGADANWNHIAMKMNFLLTAQKCVDLGINPKTVNDSYSMSEIARDFSMGKTPTSKSNLLRTLQMVITAMLGESYKVTSHDVNFLLSVYARKTRKALTVACANHRNFRNYIAEICHRIVTEGSYIVDYKTKKESTSATPKESISAEKADETAA